jgi:hypothetical protein
MSAIEPSVLVDDSGRRRRALRHAGRVVSVLLLIWLAVLALAWLGIEPLGNLDFVDPIVGRVSPTALPAHIESAVKAGRVVAPPARLSPIGGRSEPGGARAGGDVGPRRHTGDGKRLNATPIPNRPVSGSGSAPTGTAPSSIPAQPPAGSGTGTRKGAESRQTEGSSSPGKSQSSPGQAKRPTTTPSTGSGKSTTSPGHAKELGETSAKPTSPPKLSTSADGSTTVIGRYKRALPSP